MAGGGNRTSSGGGSAERVKEGHSNRLTTASLNELHAQELRVIVEVGRKPAFHLL